MNGPSPRPLAELMEARILHSADLAPLLLEPAAVNAFQLPNASTGQVGASVQRSEIVFVDAGVPDAESLLADLQAQQAAGRAIEIITIESNQDGVALITAALAGRADIAAIHIIAHGADGLVQLGAVTLDAKTLMARAGEVASWGAALTADADLLLYGCDVAQTELGQSFVNNLAVLTGADVAASTDLTGAAALGGNWVLEFGSGSIETALALNAEGQQHGLARWRWLIASESSGGTTLATISYDFSHNVNSGRDRLLLVEVVLGNSASSVTAISFEGAALSFVAVQNSPTHHVRVELWRLGRRRRNLPTSGASLVFGLDAGRMGAHQLHRPIERPQASAPGSPAHRRRRFPDGRGVRPYRGDLVVDIVGARRDASAGILLRPGQTQNFEPRQRTGVTDLSGHFEPGRRSQPQ